jgi:hypothetical protein
MRTVAKLCFLIVCVAVLLSGGLGAVGPGPGQAHACDYYPSYPPYPDYCYQFGCGCWGDGAAIYTDCGGGALWDDACQQWCEYFYCGMESVTSEECNCYPIEIYSFDPLICLCF